MCIKYVMLRPLRNAERSSGQTHSFYVLVGRFRQTKALSCSCGEYFSRLCRILLKWKLSMQSFPVSCLSHFTLKMSRNLRCETMPKMIFSLRWKRAPMPEPQWNKTKQILPKLNCGHFLARFAQGIDCYILWTVFAWEIKACLFSCAGFVWITVMIIKWTSEAVATKVSNWPDFRRPSSKQDRLQSAGLMAHKAHPIDLHENKSQLTLKA